jgi:hypothetical protein
MKITEQQLRDIIRTTISEALDMGTVNGANRYLNHQGGYTTNQQWNGLGGQLRQRFGAKTDSNGQMDWQNSANEIQGYLSQYQNEVRRLTRVYNLITGHVADSNRSAAAKKGATTRAMNRAAGIGPKRTAPKWGNAAYGGMDCPTQLHSDIIAREHNLVYLLKQFRFVLFYPGQFRSCKVTR